MRKLVVGAQVSMDGVMQAPGGPDEDPTGGFRFGGWQARSRCPERAEELDHLFSEPFDLLLGRKTYENFAAFWPSRAKPRPSVASPSCSTARGSTWSRARVKSRRAGSAPCACATSPR
jgi:dihydrofolate reductase